MKKLAIFAAALTFSGAAFANSIIDSRGYAQCEDTVNREFSDAGLTLNRTYFVKRTDVDRIYYMNGFVWHNDAREPLAATCVTTPNGRDVLELDTQIGTHVSIEEIAMR